MPAQGEKQKNRLAQPTLKELPVVAIVGRPNVGKSTLFNRVVRGRIAIVDDEPGVTRDRNYKEAYWSGKRFFVVDTGGLVPTSRDTIETLVRKQVEAAIDEASVIILVVDAKTGLTPLDEEITDLLRRKGKPFILAVNKVDSRAGSRNVPEFYRLGLERFITISAEQGTNINTLLDAVAVNLPETAVEPEKVMAVAVVGKPNVGKSSLVNRLTGTDTVIVHPEPGTTRDSVDTFIETERGRVCLVDTAGLRRKSRTKGELEKYANIRSIRAIDRSDVVIVVLDPSTGLVKQDINICSYAIRNGKGVILAWNKWDLLTSREKPIYSDLVRQRLKNAPYLPVLFISCLTGEGVGELMELCFETYANLDARIPTGVLNRTLLAAIESKPPRGIGRKFGKVYYAAQTGTRPPCFTLFVNDPSIFNDTYLRYVEKIIREIRPFDGVPVRIRIRKSK